MNEDTNKSAICHHKLAKRDLVNVLEENYSLRWRTKQQ